MDLALRSEFDILEERIFKKQISSLFLSQSFLYNGIVTNSFALFTLFGNHEEIHKFGNSSTFFVVSLSYLFDDHEIKSYLFFCH